MIEDFYDVSVVGDCFYGEIIVDDFVESDEVGFEFQCVVGVVIVDVKGEYFVGDQQDVVVLYFGCECFEECLLWWYQVEGCWQWVDQDGGEVVGVFFEQLSVGVGVVERQGDDVVGDVCGYVWFESCCGVLCVVLVVWF